MQNDDVFGLLPKVTLKPLKANNLKISLKNNLTLHQTSRWSLQTRWNDRSVVDTADSALRGAWRIQMVESQAQMEDLEKETRRWWFSPRSWL